MNRSRMRWGRTGGDEIFFVIPGDAAVAKARLDALRERFRTDTAQTDFPWMSFSAGVISREQILTADSDFSRPDPGQRFRIARGLSARALKAAKDAEGKDAVVVYQPGLRPTRARRWTRHRNRSDRKLTRTSCRTF